MDPQTFSQTLTIQYGYTAYTFAINLKGLTDADAMHQPDPGGNGLNWVAGHIVGSRAGTLAVLGQEPSFPADKYERYNRGSSPMTDEQEGTVPLSEIVADFASTQDALQVGLAALTTEKLSAKAPFSPGNDENETVGSLMAGLVFHEGYHIGQLGVLRRMAGEEGMIK